MIFSNTWVTLGTTTVLSCLLLTGCPEDYSAVLEENKKLAQQKARLESINQSMQADKKVFRQQVDRLNQEIQENEAKTREKELAHEAELQKAQHTIEELEHRPNPYGAKIKALEKEKKKLEGEAKWLRSQRNEMRKSLVIQQVGGQTHDLPFTFLAVSAVVEKVLTNNGYTLLSSMQTDQKAAYITDRKTSLPPSLELSGFRNQYIVMIEKGPADHTTLWIRAEFEKLSRKGHIYSAPQAEIADIEERLIQEIHQTLAQDSATHARNF